ncbi:MAG: peptidoglycan editing factor PgeF [Desulfobacteraceae bacterium]|nr:peptidoglycan editing factor PgeF [Desulfobacteraceae bacterium]MBC2754562.1 peptidoglycan editing factor PgeF [Desulfobacteraceae bacterium]MBC2763773.1 peptidoglycan editing factor PgeF [ANME-2 cluster archaeon]
MILNNKNNLHFFTFSKLSVFEDIRHGIFTRNNGFSTGGYKSLNAGLSVGDSNKSVEKNRISIARCMDTQKLVFSNQVHETGILVFKKNDKNRSSKVDASPFSGDAMITDIPCKPLAIQLADCQGILMYDPQNKVVANVHSGWRGSIKNILGTCVESMKTEFECRPEDITAGISPSLGPCCAEFIHYQQEIPEKYWRYKNKSGHFNFWKISWHQLLNAGLLPQNIEISNICTKCNSHLFFSFRKKNPTGRFVSVIGLK